MQAREFVVYLALLALAVAYFMGAQAVSLPYLMLRTFIRMLGAYFLSLVFSISVGIFIVHNRKAFSVVFPVLDILQSVPILGFLPFAILFIIHVIPVVGSEVAAMFLIFTSMTWAVVFNVIEGVRSIPSDLRDASRLMNLKGADYFFHVLLPAIYGPVISGSIAAWGGGWYFLVAGEYVTFGNAAPYVLPGVGSFIAQSAYSGNFLHSIIGLGVLAAMVLFMNVFVWGPLLTRASRFSYSQTAGAEAQQIHENPLTAFIIGSFNAAKRFVLTYLSRSANFVMGILGICPMASLADNRKLSTGDYAIAIFVVVAFIAICLFSGRTGDVGMIGLFSVFSLGRIVIGYVIALVLAVTVAIYIGRNQALTDALMPFFDVAQSVPAIAVFPVIVVFVIHTIGGFYGMQIASILLLLTGMVWYLLFNLIRAVQAIPNDLIEAARLLRMGTIDKVRHVFLPAIFPTLIIASMQAVGGGWNASIVSEYIVYGNEVFHANGLGYLLDLSASKADVPGILLSVLAMVAVIILVNKTVWKTALRKAELYKL